MAHKKVHVTKGKRLPHGYKTVKASDKDASYGTKSVHVDKGYRLPHGTETVKGSEKILYDRGGKIKMLQYEIAEYEALLADKSVPQDEKDFAKDEIADLKKQIAEIEKAPEPKAEPKKKPTVAPKPKKAPAPKFGADKTCEELEAMYNKRRASAKKSEKKHKTQSVASQLGDKVASVVGKIIDNIPKADIKESPKAFINKLETVEKHTKAFLESLKGILSDDYDRKELIEPFEKTIGEFIKQIKTKYSK